MAVRKRPTAATTALSDAQELKQVRAELTEMRTSQAIHDAVEQIAKSFTQLNAMVQENKQTLHRIESQVTATNGRVTILEMWRSKTTGVWAAIAAGASLVGWAIGQFIGFFHK